MVVQHNMQAANASRVLNVTAGQQSKSTEKLSSGYRINRAADDAAGLSISEKMRKQIRGLDRASTNAQDGVSAVQTAEGALTEVHSMLQRMNELAVQSANGTNAQSDRDAIQSEIDQLTKEIDRVSETTKFNETYLLKGDSAVGTKDLYTLTGGEDSKLTIADGKEVFAKDGTTALSEAEAKAKRDAGETLYKEAANQTAAATKSELVVNLGSWASATDKLIIGGKEYTGADGDAVAAAINADTDGLGKDYTATFNSGTSELSIEAKNAGASTAPTLDTGSLVNNSSSITSAGTNGTDAVYSNRATADEAGDDEYTYTKSTKLYDDTGAEVTDSSKVADLLKDGKLFSKPGANAADAVTAANITDYAKKTTVNADLTLNLHVGADSAQDNKISLSIASMSSKGIGVDGLKVDTETAATSAIDTISSAIQAVSTQRSNLGAIQNRLEHTIDNLDNVVENTTAAESRIRDTDMADEMVKYSKNNILTQAGQSMLAQANQSTQGVLSLLQ